MSIVIESIHFLKHRFLERVGIEGKNQRTVFPEKSLPFCFCFRFFLKKEKPLPFCFLFSAYFHYKVSYACFVRLWSTTDKHNDIQENERHVASTRYRIDTYSCIVLRIESIKKSWYRPSGQALLRPRIKQGVLGELECFPVCLRP